MVGNGGRGEAMSILQSGYPPSEFCVADFCKKGIKVGFKDMGVWEKMGMMREGKGRDDGVWVMGLTCIMAVF